MPRDREAAGQEQSGRAACLATSRTSSTRCGNRRRTSSVRTVRRRIATASRAPASSSSEKAVHSASHFATYLRSLLLAAPPVRLTRVLRATPSGAVRSYAGTVKQGIRPSLTASRVSPCQRSQRTKSTGCVSAAIATRRPPGLAG